ncbi:PP2C family protein-serine/threonine phosphatase [Streptomyces lomondensis]|uniref:PP2C family protein-serine/threonine phosphatase n=1 Tax=Streptomyces lomondensis TaxID=68229 RepID=UPI0027E34AD2|nr:SpoIIE family protein phosphatase [Streptomyces lomondensis]
MVERDQAAGPGRPAAEGFRHAERAVAAIGTTLDARTTAAELAAFLTEELCESATVELVSPDEQLTEPGDFLRRAATAGRHDLLERLEKIQRPEDVRVRALDAGHPIAACFTPPSGAGLAALAVPLPARGRTYGVVLALRTGRPFDDDETATVQHTARLAAAHLRHAHEYQEVNARVWDLQQVLLADPGRPHPNVELATRYLPVGRSALVGGDWCETVRLHFGRTLLVIGDVMGHGLDAAVDMNAYRTLLRYVAATDLPPHRILRRVDATMCEERGRRPATCLLALLDPARETVAFASAGHLPPVVFHRDGTAELVPAPVGPPLGTGFGAYEVAAVPVAADDTLVLFTDGLVERRGEDIDTSLARLATLRVRPGQPVSRLLDEILGRLGAHQADDDVAALAARIRHRGSP